MDTTYITLLADVPFTLTLTMYVMMALVWGAWGAFALTQLDVIFTGREVALDAEPNNRCLVWPVPSDWTAPYACSYSVAPMHIEPAPYRDIVSVDRLEVLFMDYSMDQLEEAMEVTALLAKVQKNDHVVEWTYNAPVPTVEDHWAHFAEVMSEIPFIGYIGDGRVALA